MRWPIPETQNLFRHRRGGGFTLTELLMAIGIIVLLLAMAVPLFNSFAGTRSVDAGQNLVSSMLQRARSRAIGLQEPRGIFFFEDPGTRRVAMVTVKMYSDPNTTYEQIYTDAEADTTELLPPGLGAAFVLPQGAGFPTYQPYGLVLFDGNGKAMMRTYKFLNGDTSISSRWNGNSPSTINASHVAVMLFDRSLLPEPDGGQTPGTFSTTQSNFIQDNSAAFTVNRYNGTIARGD